MKPIIGITMGDPAGVGPEIVLKAAARLSRSKNLELVIFGDREHLFSVQKKVFRHKPAFLHIWDFKNVSRKAFRFGVATAAGGRAAGDYISFGIQAAMEGLIDALVTAPINKEAFRMGGWGQKFVGHTEMLAGLTGARHSALMMVYGSLRAVHVTSHIPLGQVVRRLSAERIFQTIALTHRGLMDMGMKRPRIAVCGLNPHAGDNGVLGIEDRKMVAPAVRQARRRGWNVDGPLPADVLWPMVLAGKYHAGVAMYHDQGQIPIKLLAYEPGMKEKAVFRGVNVTLGLPIIRTSVAHGTAYDLAGKGVASEESLVEAILLAAQMARRKK